MASDRAKIEKSAERHVKAGRLADAVAEYEKLLDGTAQDAPVQNIIGDLYLQLGEDGKAVALFEGNLETLESKGAFSQALAIAKKIQKLRPSSTDGMIRVGDLYGRLGFTSEAKAEYARAQEELDLRNDVPASIALLEKLVRIDRSDLASRLKLARLYVKSGRLDRAAAELNEAAEILNVRDENQEAERVLLEALEVQPGGFRTIANLARVYRKLGRSGDAVALIERTLKEFGDRPDLLNSLADLLLDAGDEDRAVEVLNRLLVEDPQNAVARIKLARAEIRRDGSDRAYQLLDPMVTDFIRRKRDNEAIGLLGLFLSAPTVPCPVLERLAGIYRSTGRRAELETALRALLGIYRETGSPGEKTRVLKELLDLNPSDPDLRREAAGLDLAIRSPSEAEFPEPLVSDEDREIIRMNLQKAELYVGQGLVRNARRILENLRFLYPEELRIKEQLDALRLMPSGVDVGEIPKAVRKVGHMETEKDAAAPPPPPTSPPAVPSPPPIAAPKADPPVPASAPPAKPVRGRPLKPSADSGPKISAAEIFEGLDVAPTARAVPAAPPVSAEFLDLDEKIEEEIEALEAEFYKQLKEKAAVIEKDLAEIVREFRLQVETKIDERNFEARYHLGLAFLEQGLYDEAAAEFERAAADEERAADCFGLIGRCYIQKKNPAEARRWLERALDAAVPGSTARFALAYELAALYESLDENALALGLYREVQGWKPRYRNTAKRVKILEKIVS